MQHRVKIFIPKGLSSKSPYVYGIRHKPSMQLYIGSKYSEKTCDSAIFMTEDGYQTSSKYIAKRIKNDRLDSFEILFIRHFATKEEVINYEFKFLHTVDAKNNPRYINESNGGISYGGGCKKGSLFWNNRTINIRSNECPGEEWVLGMIMSDEHAKNRSNSHKDVSWYNNTIIEKSCRNNPGKGWTLGRLTMSQTAKDKMSESRTGCSWYTNNKKELFTNELPIGDNWRRGRLKGIITNESKRGNHWWTDNKIEICCKECPEGLNWRRGRLPSSDETKKKISNARNRQTVVNEIKTH